MVASLERLKSDLGACCRDRKVSRRLLCAAGRRREEKAGTPPGCRDGAEPERISPQNGRRATQRHGSNEPRKLQRLHRQPSLMLMIIWWRLVVCPSVTGTQMVPRDTLLPAGSFPYGTSVSDRERLWLKESVRQTRVFGPEVTMERPHGAARRDCRRHKTE